jgi:hypothetical protein
MILQEGSSSRRWLLWFLEAAGGLRDGAEAESAAGLQVLGGAEVGGSGCAVAAGAGDVSAGGRARPVPVRVSRMTLDTYWPDDVAGALRDPPEPVWMDAARR